MRFGAPWLAMLLTLASGCLVFGLAGKAPAEAMYLFFLEPLASRNGWAELLLKASPLCLIGLGLSVCYRANVWNIGAEGQMIVGGMAASGIALYFQPANGAWLLPAMLLAGVIGGMAWAAIPALLRSRFNTNEILISLMLTYVAAHLLIYLVSGPWRDPQGMNFPLTKAFDDDALFPRLYGDWHWLAWRGTRLNASVLLTLLAIPAAWLFLYRSFAGYQMMVGGLAPLAARYAGFSHTRAIWTAMLVSGASAGLAGVTEIAGTIGQLQSTWSPGYGYTAIIVAFLGRLHPLGIVLASLLMALLYLGGEAAQTSLQMPKSISAIFQGLLLFFLLGGELFVSHRLRRIGHSSPGTAQGKKEL